MKDHLYRTSLRTALLAAGVGFVADGALAAPFLYKTGDLLLAFRQAGNSSDYVVDLGSAAAFSTLATNSTLVVTNLSAAQLTAAFSSLNGLNWSAAAATRDASDPKFPAQTLWVSAPRPSATQPSAAWFRKGVYTQGNAASEIDAIGNNAAASSSSQAAGPNNTATGVVIPVNTGYAVTPLLGDSGNFVNTFQGDAEASTPLDFDSQANNASWVDLYELLPGATAAGTLNTAGRYLGYFALQSDGTLTFSNASPGVAAPTIAGIQVAKGVTTVSFQSVQGATYSLLNTGVAEVNAPASGWNAGPSVVGNGSVLSLQSTNTDAVQFFTLEVKP